ncbi:trafficking protein particle complex subunit 9-like [Mya arenaria]|uniref:trafficking protein particle complex subunit 9-like n=1 Tax=Mya arenaria TaxID=6604 RepID=UPI0022E0F61A|nr:trafficking protein particle complex subunit 9-like [Mya arenaria]
MSSSSTSSNDVDYGQTAEDHRRFLLLVRQTGKLLSWKHFSRCWDRVCQMDCVAIPGQKREMWIRYKRQYTPDCNEWGDFQIHRKALGLISIGRCSNEAEFEELFENYKKEKEIYADSLYNSRLVVFGMNTDGSPLPNEQSQDSGENSPAPTFRIDSDNNETNACDKDDGDTIPNDKSDKLNSNDLPILEHSDPLRQVSDKPKGNESKSSNGAKTNNNNEKTTNEQLDSTSRSQITFIKKQDSKKGSLKKENKLVEELKKPESMKKTGSSGSLRDASGAEVVFYPGVDNSDGLEECVREFVTSLFFVLEGKRLDRSFERGDKTLLLCAPFEKKDYVGVDTDTKSFKKKCQGRFRKHLADLCLLAGMPGEAMLHYSTALDTLKPVNDWLWMAGCYEGLCAAAVITQYGSNNSHLQPASIRRNQSFSTKRGVASNNHERQKSVPVGGHHSYSNGLQDLHDSSIKSNINPDDIVEKYKDALQYYSKYKTAAVVEMEACFKACRILISQKRFLQAADFLQEVIYIAPQLNDEDRIHRYITMSTLYGQIGFSRKASFFRRVAAMQCVAPQTPKPNWPLCHQLLIQSLPGYKLYLDQNDSTSKPGDTHGWPVIQTRVLHELIFSAKKMGNMALAVRYLTILLHTQLDYLSVQEKRDLVSNLQSFTEHCEGTTQTLAVESGALVPHVPLISVPLVKSFKLMPLETHLEPKKILTSESSVPDSVFIFTPLHLGPVSRPDCPDVDFSWVEGDIAEVQLLVHNPLPDNLPLTHIGLITEGLEVEAFPTSPTIPAEHGLYAVKIKLVPAAAGQLNILGYNTKLYGVRSNCKLRDCPSIPQSHFTVKVAPGLPSLQLMTSLTKADDFLSFGEEFNIVTSATAVLYTGQSSECTVTLQNSNKLPVEWVNVTLESMKDAKDYVCEVFQWNNENIQSQLPISPSGVLCFNMALQGVGDFLLHKTEIKTNSWTREGPRKAVGSDGRVVEGILKVEYSGGPGYRDNYCRCSSVAFNVDILPSLVFTKWDVMLSESSEHCYLMFDVKNLSSHELDVQYSGQCVCVKPEHTRRVCIEVERFEPNSIPSQSYDSFSQFLATFVDIRWTIPSLNVNGRLETEHLTWTREQQQIVYTSPVLWDVHLNGQVISPLHIGSLEYKVGQPVTLEAGFQLKSECSSDLEGRSGELTLCCCQHYDNGEVSHNTNSYVMSVESQSICVPQISADIPITHSCMFIFTCSGFYKFEIQMKVEGQPRDSTDSNIQGHHHSNQSVVTSSDKGQGHQSQSNLTGQGLCSNSEDTADSTRSNDRVFKCMSVIEVNIIE